MWAFMASWFTPTVLFCVLNLIIGTIFITSNLITHNKPPAEIDQHNPQPPQLVRTPSFLEQVRSFSFSLYGSENPDPLQPQTHHADPPEVDQHNQPQLVRAPSLLERVRSSNFSLYRSEHPDPLLPPTHHADPPEVDQHNLSPRQLVRAPSFLERVKSFNFSLYRSEHADPLQPHTHHADPPPHEEAHDHDQHLKRSMSDKTVEASPAMSPANMKKSASEKLRVEEDGEGVDAKADDFINRFKQHLKLQRLDSILRYREMLSRGSGK